MLTIYKILVEKIEDPKSGPKSLAKAIKETEDCLKITKSVPKSINGFLKVLAPVVKSWPGVAKALSKLDDVNPLGGTLEDMQDKHKGRLNWTADKANETIDGALKQQAEFETILKNLNNASAELKTGKIAPKTLKNMKTLAAKSGKGLKEIIFASKDWNNAVGTLGSAARNLKSYAKEFAKKGCPKELEAAKKAVEQHEVLTSKAVKVGHSAYFDSARKLVYRMLD